MGFQLGYGAREFNFVFFGANLFWERLTSRKLEYCLCKQNSYLPHRVSTIKLFCSYQTGIRAKSMTKKNTETSMMNRMDSMEEAVSVMQNEMGGLREELASLREYLQQTLKIQQEIIILRALTGKRLNPLE